MIAINDILSRRRVRGAISGACIYIFLSAGAFLCLLPLIWMISTSLKEPGNVFLYPPQWIPRPVRWENYAEIFTEWPFLTYLRNTMTITFLHIVGVTLSSALVAYAFSHLRWPGRGVCFIMCMATMMLPGQVTMAPTFIMFVKLGWLDSFKPLVVPAFFGSAFFIFLLRQFFRTIPRSLIEAARIDGCGEWRIFFFIMMPLSVPALLITGIYTFIGSWNDFMGPLIYLSSDSKRTLALALAYFGQSFISGITLHTLMAASLIVMLPCIVLFFALQKHFMQGMVFSGLKE
ncbi:MAG: carbohydrate ABC transporter permease [bacterium]|nr:carbohydrate ABC transporter permease [Candidatus Sumerlaeota bacterium]